MPGRKSVQLNVAVTPIMKEQIDKWAEKKDMTTPSFVRHCIKVCVAAYEKQENGKK